MPAKTISQLTQATTINNADEFAIEQSGVTKRVAASVVRGDIVDANIKSDAAIASTKLSVATQESLVPAGAIMPFARSTAPSGWLECNGAEVAIATYGALSAAIYVGDGSNADADLVYGFKTNGSGTRSTSGTHVKLPDLRGEFIRGWDNARGIDSSRKNRSYQADELKAHTHTVVDDSITTTTTPGGVVNITFPSGTQTRTTSSTGGTETRSRNVTALYCIKF